MDVPDARQIGFRNHPVDPSDTLASAEWHQDARTWPCALPLVLRHPVRERLEERQRQGHLDEHRQAPPSPSNEVRLALRVGCRHARAAVADIYVHLASETDISGKVDSRLHREPDPGNEPPVIARLQIVEIRTGPMQL